MEDQVNSCGGEGNEPQLVQGDQAAGSRSFFIPPQQSVVRLQVGRPAAHPDQLGPAAQVEGGG